MESEYEHIEKWCSLHEKNVTFRKENLIYYKKGIKQPPKKGRDTCMYSLQCKGIDCKWVNGSKKDYLIDIE